LRLTHKKKSRPCMTKTCKTLERFLSKDLDDKTTKG
jgi:hypothetical protein